MSGRNSGNSGGAAHSGGSSGNSGAGQADAVAAAEAVHDSAAEKAARVKEKNRHVAPSHHVVADAAHGREVLTSSNGAGKGFCFTNHAVGKATILRVMANTVCKHGSASVRPAATREAGQ